MAGPWTHVYSFGVSVIPISGSFTFLESALKFRTFPVPLRGLLVRMCERDDCGLGVDAKIFPNRNSAKACPPVPAALLVVFAWNVNDPRENWLPTWL
jgi:hypothetical protein